MLTLLTRVDCHLCDRMEDAVRPLAAARGIELAVVDVDSDPALAAAYGARIPVLLEGGARDGVELCRFRLDRARLDEALTRLCARHDTFASAPKIR